MYKARIEKVYANMQAAGLEQIIVSSPASYFYLTGVWPHPGERLYVLYLNVDGTATVFANELFGTAVQAGLPVVYHKDTDIALAGLAAAVKKGKIGVDKFWPAKFAIGLMEACPHSLVCLGSAPVDDARMCKDAAEIDEMRRASRMNDDVMAFAISAVKGGATEEEIAKAILQKYASLTTGKTEDVIVSFGPNGADPHHGPDKTVLKPGDSIVIDISIPAPLYWCDMTRTVFFKEAGAEQRKVYETVKNANLAAEAAIKPGLPMCTFDGIARKYIEDAGYGKYFTHRLGHGIGLEVHEPPDNSASENVIAKPGMVFSVEPGIYLPGNFGVRVEDLVLVTETGCEVLNAFTKDIIVLP